MGTAAGEFQGDAEPDAAGGPRHDGDFVLESLHHGCRSVLLLPSTRGPRVPRALIVPVRHLRLANSALSAGTLYQHTQLTHLIMPRDGSRWPRRCVEMQPEAPDHQKRSSSALVMSRLPSAGVKRWQWA